jgi:UV DNA damage repair endonuclease
MATPLVDFERHKHKINDRTNAEDSGNLESCSSNARKLWRTDLVSMAERLASW